MAEGLFRCMMGGEVTVHSAGLMALEGRPPDPDMQSFLLEHGLDVSAHRGRQCTPEMILAADLILVMDQRQKTWCETWVPSARGRVFLLGQWLEPLPLEIEDPYHRRPKAFHQTYDLVIRAVAGWMLRMTHPQRST